VTLPIEGRMRRFDAALPADFADAWQRLRDSDRS
jgi:hypothetical protein